MASRIEHEAKAHAYMRCATWDANTKDAESCYWFSKQKWESHEEYLRKMKATGAYWYGSPPRNRFLNWLGHKLIEWAW